MTGSRWPRIGLNWRSAALLGLISSTFSTLVSQFTATRIGRDALVDWMTVATIPLRSGIIHVDPSWMSIVAGILFHQWADFSWALVFFGLFGRWTASLGPWALLLLALPWAVFTSSLEWFFLVPLLPFRQPIFILEQPYWIGFLVHATSASIYPLFPRLRDWMAGRVPSPHRRFAGIWSFLAVFGLVVLGALAFLGWQNRELPWMGQDAVYDQAYMRRIAAHHDQGLELALLAVERAQDPDLRDTARLMAASQKGDIAVFRQFWSSWFPGLLPPATAEDHRAMPGMLSADRIGELRRVSDDGFAPLFISLMTHHHQGAIAMADETLHGKSDIRLRLMAHAIRHGQRGEIELMRGTEGFAAVKAATMSLFRPGEPTPTSPDEIPCRAPTNRIIDETIPCLTK
ncbi:DUF305 domain-containing protein [Microvirga rosea]|uniref:DUF305 domain-containing protein n=1 Tax=Microvirga rosea TaxID=2715425 RepID=UPI001D0A1525|nr:DUF305 domain-containing protein [Microvirga rosea]MCB8821840.1 DUF305 domain-containing protein [Microvirga rosea]